MSSEVCEDLTAYTGLGSVTAPVVASPLQVFTKTSIDQSVHLGLATQGKIKVLITRFGSVTRPRRVVGKPDGRCVSRPEVDRGGEECVTSWGASGVVANWRRCCLGDTFVMLRP